MAIEVQNMKRRFNVVFPLKRIGFLFPHPPQALTTFSGKLEICLRIRSESEYAEDIIDDLTYRTTFPHVILKRPGSIHTYTIDKPREGVYLQYDPSLEGKMDEAGLLRTECCWPIKIGTELSSLLSRMHDATGLLSQRHGIDALDLLAMQFFECLLIQQPARDDIPEHIERQIHEIASFFRIHVTDEFDLSTVLAQAGLSRRTFFRYWPSFFSVSPSQYIKELKLQYARVLLEETTVPVWKLAKELKFMDSHYLCRIFRERFGQTPLQYRKSKDD